MEQRLSLLLDLWVFSGSSAMVLSRHFCFVKLGLLLMVVVDLPVLDAEPLVLLIQCN